MNHKEIEEWEEQQEHHLEEMAGEPVGHRKRMREFERKAGCDRFGRDTSH